MKKTKLLAAIAETERFLARAKELEKNQGHRQYDSIWNPRLAGGVTRASMDLTRSLADLRKVN